MSIKIIQRNSPDFNERFVNEINLKYKREMLDEQTKNAPTEQAQNLLKDCKIGTHEKTTVENLLLSDSPIQSASSRHLNRFHTRFLH